MKKNNLFILFTFLVIVLSSCQEIKEYEVEVTFCDGRPKKRIIVKDYDRQSNADVKTYKRAVPLYRGLLNVCDVKTLREIK